MNKLELRKGITWIGALDPDLRVFDIVMTTEFGTTYNSYLVQGDDKIALFETVKVKFFEAYLEKLQSMVAIESIDYIVVDHTEPDHSGSIEKLLELNPNIKIVGSSSAIGFLEEITNRTFESIKVNTGDTLDLGNKTLEFISAPFLHWPDSIYTYIREDKVLISCDSFGAHYCFDEILISQLNNKNNYHKALRYYYNMIMGPFKTYVLQAIRKIEKYDIEMICPGHGPVLDEDPIEIVNIYHEWSSESTIFSDTTVVIPYVSAYGYTKELAEKIAEGIESTKQVNVHLYDMVTASKAEVMEHIQWADGILFGTPTINGDALPPIWDLVLSMSPINHKGKQTAVFGSYGWSGEGVPNIEGRLKQVRTKAFAPGLKVRFKPSEDQLNHAFEYGKAFADQLVGNLTDHEFLNEAHHIEKQNGGDGTIKRWICIVCGDVFEGDRPPELCPTCGASYEQFEVYLEEEVTYQSDETLDIVIIGNGLAGLTAAKEARLRNKRANITIYTEEKHPTYNRPMLIDYVLDDYNHDHFIIEGEDFYEDQNIHVVYGTRVTTVNHHDKYIVTSEGTVNFDRLILANGSQCFLPPITDIRSKGVFVLKDIKDANAIINDLEDVKEVAVIGGGLLGLEAADTFNLLGKHVTLFEVADALAPQQLDQTVGNHLKTLIESKGVRVVTGACISHIAATDRVEGLALTTGDYYEAQLILVSTGIRANTELIKNKLSVNKGVVVNDRMETSQPFIYAAGDVAEFDGKISGLYQTAIEQGRVAGANAVGDDISFSYTLAPAQFNNFDIEFFAVGETFETDDITSVIVNDLDKGKYSRLFFKDEVLVGGMLYGDMSKSLAIMNGIKREALRSDFTREFFG